MNIQLLFFKNREFKLKQAEQFNISISSIKLLRPGAYTDNDFFNEKVMIIRLTENNSSDFVEPEKIKEAMLTPKLVSDVISSSDKSSNLELEEVDLHIEELIDDSSSLAAKEILDIQLARFTTALEGAINAKTKRMVFIHDVKINILDTPGHQDFAEDTFRTLTAVDSVIIVVDCAKGVEMQTKKLMDVCRMRNTPVIVFINKLDRVGRDPFDLLDEIEKELQISVRPLSWPISMFC